jgi:phosphoribosyl 1,2-cyclic phosphodiesterase
MKLRVIASSSAGNGYLFETKGDALVVEAGVKFIETKKLLDFNVSKISGLLLSHEHGDHSGFAGEYVKAGIKTYSSQECLDSLNIKRNAIAMQPKQLYKIGSFKVMAFDVVHDVKCFGFLIDHPESGKFVFITDTHYSPVKFTGLNNIIIEANYSEEIIWSRLQAGTLNPMQYARVRNSHMSLETAIKLLQANDLTDVNNIVLIHLSDGNSDEKGFVRKVSALTGKSVYAAKKGLEVDFNKTGI